jgi:hypothetical protein
MLLFMLLTWYVIISVILIVVTISIRVITTIIAHNINISASHDGTATFVLPTPRLLLYHTRNNHNHNNRWGVQTRRGSTHITEDSVAIIKCYYHYCCYLYRFVLSFRYGGMALLLTFAHTDTHILPQLRWSPKLQNIRNNKKQCEHSTHTSIFYVKLSMTFDIL